MVLKNDVMAALVEEAPASQEMEQRDETPQEADHEAHEEEIDATAPEGDETEDEIPEGEEPEPDTEYEDVITLKVDGEEREIPLDELVEAYQIDGAARKRLQEATEAKQRSVEEGRAEGWKQAQGEIESRQTEVETTRKQLGELVGVIGTQLFAPQVARPDPVMESQDPIGYITAMERWRADQERIHGLQSQIAQATRQQRAQAEQQQARVMQENQRQLYAKRPELAQPEVQQAFTQNVRRAQEFAGMTSDEVNNFPDHRGLIVLDKLGELLGQLAGKMPAQKRVVDKARKPMKPGAVTYKRTQRQKQMRQDRDRAKKSGDYRDVAKLLMTDSPKSRR